MAAILLLNQVQRMKHNPGYHNSHDNPQGREWLWVLGILIAILLVIGVTLAL